MSIILCDLFPRKCYNHPTMTEQAGNQLGNPSPALVKALRLLLKPLIRLFLSSGITFPYLSSLLKELYIEIADKDFSLDNKKQTDSRISMLTGIHRRDTRRLRNLDIDDERMPQNVSTTAQIIALWVGKPEYLDAQGRPRPLVKKSLIGTTDDHADFETLVKNVNKQDIRPRVILDEWLRLGVVHMDEYNRVVLNTEAFIPQDNFADKAYYFGQNLHDHIAASSHNLLGNSPPFFERSVYYNCLSDKSVKKLKKLSDELGMDALKKLNRQTLHLQEQDQEQQQQQQQQQQLLSRINFGIYFYSSAENSEQNNNQPDNTNLDNS